MKNKYLNILKYLSVLLIFFFIGKYIYININELKNIHISFNICYLLSSIAVLLFYSLILILIWHFITKKNNCNLNLKQSIVAKAYSNLGKYIPGKIGGLAILFYFYKKENKPLKDLSVCVITEAACSVLASILFFVFSLFFIPLPVFQKYRIVAILLLIVIFICINPKILEHIINFILKLAKKELIKINFTYKTILQITLMHVINFFIFGVSIFLFINSVYNIPVSRFIFIISSFIFSSLIGFLAFFTPSGLGVREGMLILLLKYIMPGSMAGILSITSRILLVTNDLLLFFIVFLYSKNEPTPKRQNYVIPNLFRNL